MSQEYYSGVTVYEVAEDSTAYTLVIRPTSGGDPLTDLESAGGPAYFHARTRDGVAVVTDHPATVVDDTHISAKMNAALVSGGPRDLIAEFEIQDYDSAIMVADTIILRVLPRAKVSS